MLAAFLSMCESGADLRRHPILPTLRRLERLHNDAKEQSLPTSACSAGFF